MTFQSAIYVGAVMHRRVRPRRHRFRYRVFWCLFDLDELPGLQDSLRFFSHNRRNLFSLRDRDHGDGSGNCLEWITQLLLSEGIRDAQGEIWLHTYPRVLGYAFKPVSFWYCHRRDGSLAAVVVEVNNTFGERHCYLLAGEQVRFGRELTATKVFHVSPFCDAQGGYRFRFMRTADRTVKPPGTPSAPATANAACSSNATTRKP